MMRDRPSRCFAADRRGAIAVEFALLLPLMLVLLGGAFELTRLARASIRASAAAQTVADLISQQNGVTTASMANFCRAAKIVITPFASSGLAVTAASVTKSGTTTAVDWQDTSCGSASSISTAATLGSGYTPNYRDSVIVVRVAYSYTPVFTTFVSSSLVLTRMAYARPRGGTTITHS